MNDYEINHVTGNYNFTYAVYVQVVRINYH